MTRRDYVCHIGFGTGLLLMASALIAEIWSQWSPPVVLHAIRLHAMGEPPGAYVVAKPGDEAVLEKWGVWYRLCPGVAVETITDRQGKPWEGRPPRRHPIKTPPEIGPIKTGPRPQPWVIPSDLPDGDWMVNLEPLMTCWWGERLFPIQTPRVQAPFTVRR